ncbi:MAG: phage tail sheath family protein, partial [Fusobacteriaceae bacterium]
EDIIGGIDTATLEAKGLEVLGSIFQKYSMIPSLVIVPGFSHEPDVRAILDTKSSKIGGKWGAMSIVDLPSELKYGELIEYKKEKNFIDEDQILTYGMGRIGEDFIPQDILLAALMSATDFTNDGIPFESPSNKNIKVEGISWNNGEKFVELNLDENQANLLNENGIVTIIKRPNGTVAWGNRTSAQQPGGITDAKDLFIPAKRMFKYIANTIMLNTEADVDRPMTFSKAENIKMKLNMFLNGLTSEGKLLGGRVEFLESENPLVDITNGRFKWHIYLGIVMPGESLEYILEYDTNYATGFFN